MSIPVGESRKHCYLTVEQMTKLYRVFIEKRYPEPWKSGYAERAHYSLGGAPSGTWCRHSYGTNLSHARVEQRYISESMGHSTNHPITDRYIAQYPLETQFEYNSKLLDLEPKMTEEDINNMTEEQKTEMLLKLLVKK